MIIIAIDCAYCISIATCRPAAKRRGAFFRSYSLHSTLFVWLLAHNLHAKSSNLMTLLLLLLLLLLLFGAEGKSARRRKRRENPLAVWILLKRNGCARCQCRRHDLIFILLLPRLYARRSRNKFSFLRKRKKNKKESTAIRREDHERFRSWEIAATSARLFIYSLFLFLHGITIKISWERNTNTYVRSSAGADSRFVRSNLISS